MKRYVDLFRRCVKAARAEAISLKPARWRDVQEEALADWRKWLAEESPMAVWSLSMLGQQGLELRAQERARWVMMSMDLRRISGKEWQKAVGLAIKEIEKMEQKSGQDIELMMISLGIAMADGICNGDAEAIDYDTWLALWKISPQLGLNRLGGAGYYMVLGLNPSEEQQRAGIAEIERTKNAAGVIWGKNKDGNPVAKELIFTGREDIRPLLMSQNKESRILGVKLLQQKRNYILETRAKSLAGQTSAIS